MPFDNGNLILLFEVARAPDGIRPDEAKNEVRQHRIAAPRLSYFSDYFAAVANRFLVLRQHAPSPFWQGLLEPRHDVGHVDYGLHFEVAAQNHGVEHLGLPRSDRKSVV